MGAGRLLLDRSGQGWWHALQQSLGSCGLKDGGLMLHFLTLSPYV